MRISDWSSDVCSSDLNPVRSGFSFLEPTWYITDTATIGVALSRCINTVKPLSSLNSLNSMRFWAIATPLAQSDIPKNAEKIGRAECRERVCQYVSISLVAVTLKKKKK